MAATVAIRTQENTKAAGYMSVTVLVYSLAPLMIALTDVAHVPFLFNAALQVGGMVGYIAVLSVAYRPLLLDVRVLAIIGRKIWAWSIVFGVISGLDYALFVWSTRFIDISITTILFETWPFFLIALTAALFRRQQRYRRITFPMLLLLTSGFTGCAFVIASQSGGIVGLGAQSSYILAAGVVLAMGSAVMTSLAAYLFKWGSDLTEALPDGIADGYSTHSIELFGIAVAIVVTDVFSITLNSTIGFATGESLQPTHLLVGFVGGVAIYTLGSITWRLANLMTDNLGINALGYSTPVIALIWLLIFSQVGVVKLDFLIIGAAAIIAANLLINFEAEVRFGFKALILALWACGTFVYLRDDFLTYLPFGGWLWPRETYLGAVGFSATVFILLLTFRVARVAPRTQDEDNRIFALHRNLELLARRGLIAPEASEHLRAIDGARNVEELQLAYTRVKLCFVQAAAVDHTLANRRLLVNAETQLNMMVHSRQQGIDFGELFSLIIFGGSTILLSLLSRPEVSGWTAFLYEVFSALFPAVIVFLIVNVWDLHRDRAEVVLAAREGPQSYGVIFRDPRSRRFEQGVSVVIGLLIIVAYAVLLWYKWVG